MKRFTGLSSGRREEALLVLALLGTLILLGCGGGGDGNGVVGASSQVTLPALDLGAAEEGVRQQLIDQRRQVEVLLEDPRVDPAEQAEALGDLGSLYLTYDFLEAAEACFRNARDLDIGDYRWHYLLGYLVMTGGDLEAAIPSFEKALELRPDFLPALLRLGRLQLALGHPEDAGDWFQRALDLEPQAAAVHEGLGRVATSRGDLDAAVESFRRALDLEPTASGVHYAVAQVYRDLGQLDAARVHLEQSGDVATRVIDPLINPLASLAAGVQFYLVQGAEALDDGDFEAAVAAYRSALELDDNSFPAYHGLAVGLEELGDLEGARTALEHASRAADPEADPRRAERAAVERSLGRLDVLAGRDLDAVGRFRRSLELIPEQPAVLLRMANALARQGHFEEAVATYDRLMEETPQWSAAVLEKRGTAYVNLGQADEAIADFRAAIEAAPRDLGLQQRFAHALEVLGRTRAAAEQRDRVDRELREDGDPVPLLLSEARLLVSAQQFEGAVELYRRALAEQPSAVDARREMADVLGHLRRYDEAVVEYGQVLKAAPGLEAAHRGQVVAMILSGRLGEARMQLQDALRAFPRHHGFALTQVRLLSMSPDPRVRDGALAVEIARRLVADRPDVPARQALALALAAAGQLDEAVTWQRDLVISAEGEGRIQQFEMERARLAAFESGRPWTASTADEILVPLGTGPGG